MGKGGRCVRLNLPPSCTLVAKNGNLDFLEISEPVQACNGTALPLPLPLQHLCMFDIKHPLRNTYVHVQREIPPHIKDHSSETVLLFEYNLPLQRRPSCSDTTFLLFRRSSYSEIDFLFNDLVQTDSPVQEQSSFSVNLFRHSFPVQTSILFRNSLPVQRSILFRKCPLFTHNLLVQSFCSGTAFLFSVQSSCSGNSLPVQCFVQAQPSC